MAMTMKELKKQPISVIKAQLPELAEALGVEPAELFRQMTGTALTDSDLEDVAGGLESQFSDQCGCCGDDSW